MSTRVKRIFVYGGLPLAVVMASAMIARAYDTSWIASGQTVSAEQLKADLDEVQSRLAALEAHPLTDWQSYAPTLTDAANGTTIGNQTTVGQWRRVGDTIEVQIRTSLSGPPTGGDSCSDVWVWGLPAGAYNDTSKDKGAWGVGNAFFAGVNFPGLIMGAIGSAGIAGTAVDDNCGINANHPNSFGSGDSLSFFVELPIAGWGSGSGSGQ